MNNRVMIINSEAFLNICKKWSLEPTKATVGKNVVAIPTGSIGLAIYFDKDFNLIAVDDDFLCNSNYCARCKTHGVDPKDFWYFEDFIVIESRTRDIFILMTRTFDIIGFIKCDESTIIEKTQAEYLAYQYSSDRLDWFSSPFEQMKKSTLVSLASRIELTTSANVYVYDKKKKFVFINKELYAFPKSDDYILVISFIKYLSTSVNYYFERIYPLLVAGIIEKYESANYYLQALVDKLFALCREHDTDDLQKNVLDYLGQSELIGNPNIFPEGIINFCMVICNEKKNWKHFKTIVDDLSNILNLPDKEFRRKEKNRHLKTVQSSDDTHIDEDEYQKLFMQAYCKRYV